MEVQALLQRLREAKDPIEQWNILQTAPPELREHPEIVQEERWWLARYKFMDRKRTRVQDKFIWMLMFFSTWAQQNRLKNTKEPLKVYAQTLGQPEMEAMLDSPELYDRLYDAADTYVKTMANERMFLGIMPMKDKNADQTNKRISRELVQNILLPLSVCCKEKAFTPLMIRALFASAVKHYDGIRPVILDYVDQVEKVDDRAFIASCVDDIQNMYGGSNI